MPIVVNGVTVNDVVFNGVSVNVVHENGVKVFEKILREPSTGEIYNYNSYNWTEIADSLYQINWAGTTMNTKTSVVGGWRYYRGTLRDQYIAGQDRYRLYAIWRVKV